MTLILFLCGIGCFIIAFFCAYWAIEIAVVAKDKEPHFEFLIRQFTAGAWTFGLLFVASLVGAALVFNMDPEDYDEVLNPPVKEVQTNE